MCSDLQSPTQNTCRVGSVDAALIDTYAAHASGRDDGRRTAALVAVSGLSATGAYQRLRWLLSDPQAWGHDAATMRLIQTRMRSRTRSRAA